MAAFTYALLSDGVQHTIGTDFTGAHSNAHDFASRLAALPHPRPTDEVWVWAGDVWVDRNPDVRIRRRTRQAVAS